jgi:hypothetical protein
MRLDMTHNWQNGTLKKYLLFVKHCITQHIKKADLISHDLKQYIVFCFLWNHVLVHVFI